MNIIPAPARTSKTQPISFNRGPEHARLTTRTMPVIIRGGAK